MGKRLIQQRRGRGTSTFKKPSFRSKGKAKLPSASSYTVEGFTRSQQHTAPLAVVKYDNDSTGLLPAREGTAVGDSYSIGSGPASAGNTLPLSQIPEGTSIFNIEGKPGDGGKFVRASGMAAKVVLRSEKKVVVKLPSKKQKTFHPSCRATVGLVAGGGRTEKPFLRAGNKFHAMKAKHKIWPIVSGGAMNAVAHPLGNKRSSRKSKAKPAPANAPPGRKVGMIRPKKTGRKK